MGLARELIFYIRIYNATVNDDKATLTQLSKEMQDRIAYEQAQDQFIDDVIDNVRRVTGL